jgi:hypothetical protein
MATETKIYFPIAEFDGTTFLDSAAGDKDKFLNLFIFGNEKFP